MQRTISQLLELARRLLGPRQPIRSRLVDCGSCGTEFVNPVSWHERDEEQWWLRLRCGGCGAVREVVVSNEDAKRFDDDLDRGVAEIGGAVASLDRARLTAGSDTLTAALERELIDPSDFYR